jgi:hypothetical protein
MKQDVQIWLLLAMVLVVLAVQGCSQPPMVTIDEAINNNDATSVPTQQEPDTSGPTDWEAIGRTLGCVFAPETCNK